MTMITLPEAIAQLRSDLALAEHQAVGEQLRFAVKEVQVEFSIVLKTGSEATGGIKAWMVEASAKGSQAQESGHKIILKLEPRSKGQEKPEPASKFQETLIADHGGGDID